MKKCAIIIGINNVDRMPPLDGAIDGARQFEAWADSQGFDTFVITDDAGPVSHSMVFECVEDKVNNGNYSQMIIFFSGHGIWKSVNDEKWLLSRAATNSNEAINVQVSAAMAATSGITHVVFISDACRTATIHPLINKVTGGVIFPSGDNYSRHFLDLFFSTKPNDASYEIKENADVPKSFGVYTKCLLKGLKGEVKDIITTINLQGTVTPVVQAYDLQEYLEQAVQEEVENIDIALTQQPQGAITSRPPHFLSLIYGNVEIDGEPTPKAPEYFDNSWDDKPGYHGIELAKRNIRVWDDIDDESLMFIIDTFKLKKEIKKSVFDHLRLKSLRRNILLEVLRFGDRMGFVFIGDFNWLNNFSGERYLVQSGGMNRFEESGIGFIETKRDHIILQVGEDSFMPLNTLPNFHCIVTCSNNRIVNINYQPSVRNPRFDDFINRSLEVEIRRAIVYAETKHGSFTMNGRNNEFIRYANYLRNDKAYDPTLGMYAAYGYAQAGLWHEVSSVYDYMRMEPEQVLFDVRMLATISPIKYEPDGSIPLTGWPTLTQGWSYMSVKTDAFPRHLRQLAEHLVPSLWTTFTRKGAQIFEKYFNQ